MDVHGTPQEGGQGQRCILALERQTWWAQHGSEKQTFYLFIIYLFF
jgi:hypothetical protein